MPPIDWNALKGRSVIVTGGASGLGEGTVKKFAEHGAYVTIADVQEERGKELAARLSAEGKHVSFVECDTSDWASSVGAFKHAVNFAPSKTLDVALLFAGMSGAPRSLVDLVNEHPEPTLEGEPTPQSLPKALDVNLNGVYLNTWLALHYFRLRSATGSNRKKSLVIVSSLAGYVGARLPGLTAANNDPDGPAVRYCLLGLEARCSRIVQKHSLRSAQGQRASEQHCSRLYLDTIDNGQSRHQLA